MTSVAKQKVQEPSLRASPVSGPWIPPETARTSQSEPAEHTHDEVANPAERPPQQLPSILVPPGTLTAEPAAKPFVKWAGGKRKLVRDILRFVPSRFANYHEPFVGGGALFYAIRPSNAFLSDENERLVRTYRGVRDSVEDVIGTLRSYPHSLDFFEQMRKRKIDTGSDVEVAAWFIYLNKTSFNGLYRVNRRNEFNVPFGYYEHPTICDEDALRACSRALKCVSIEHRDYSSVLDKAEQDDLVYFDPPYLPLSTTSSFVNYTKCGFGVADHERLRDVAIQLKHRGVHVVLSNSAHQLVRDLYSPHFAIEDVYAARAINSCGDRRGPIRELLVH